MSNFQTLLIIQDLIAVTCIIYQKNGAGLQVSSSCYWDPALDGSTTYKIENKTMYIIVSVFGLAIWFWIFFVLYLYLSLMKLRNKNLEFFSITSDESFLYRDRSSMILPEVLWWEVQGNTYGIHDHNRRRTKVGRRFHLCHKVCKFCIQCIARDTSLPK